MYGKDCDTQTHTHEHSHSINKHIVSMQISIYRVKDTNYFKVSLF